MTALDNNLLKIIWLSVLAVAKLSDSKILVIYIDDVVFPVPITFASHSVTPCVVTSKLAVTLPEALAEANVNIV